MKTGINSNFSPLISVIMPAYNCEEFIKQAIDSILNQTYTNLELLIADDCSTDNTKKIIDSYSDLRLKTFHNDVNLGYLKASNKLLSLCAGDYITFQDADDYSDSSRVELLIHAFLNDRILGCIGSNYFSVNSSMKEINVSDFPANYEDIVSNYTSNVVMVGASLMVTKSVLNDVGPYHEFFDRIGSEDVYWYGKIIEKYKTININKGLYYYRQNPSSVSRSHKNRKALISRELAIYAFKERKIRKNDFICRGSIKEQNFVCNKVFSAYYLRHGQLRLAYGFLVKIIYRIDKLDLGFLKMIVRQTICHLFYKVVIKRSTELVK